MSRTETAMDRLDLALDRLVLAVEGQAAQAGVDGDSTGGVALADKLDLTIGRLRAILKNQA